MAFDDKTRGRLQKLVTACRGLLTDEFRIQVQQTYGLDPNSGDVTPLERLTHLSAAERETADLLRQTLAHYLASEGLADSATQRVPVIDRIVREQAFTVLNRLAALLMMEARGVLQRPAVGSGQQSPAFELYKMVAGSALGETGQAYQTFLFSLFDEFAQELPALFDRFAPQGRLFPREAALLQVLAELNHHEIQPLWGEDETIGWIYQYFNSKEERKAMRDASQAPRNSRELAVRNQFFTPRYVVEFLVDNTLGRLWFNATGGQTTLRQRCQYLLAKPDEQPAAAIRLRDPRTLKLLDPACGSMHFGLYAFDLFLTVYREAWDWERSHGAGSLDVSAMPDAGLQPLCQTYEDEVAYLRDVPRLIIEYNIYGVDIDPRAAQIASLALWLRSHRAWHDAGVTVKDRLLIGRGNVVAAIAPPAERELRQQFAGNLDECDAELFEKTLQLLKDLPQLGMLLKVERDLPHLIRQVYVGKGTGLFAEQEQESWQHAETRLRTALAEFANAAKSTYQGRLFAQDALQGLRLIDVCRNDFDAVIMNPPFGLAPKELAQDLKRSYPDAYVDLYACFVCRAIDLCRGWVGVISSRSILIAKKLERLRHTWVVPRVETVLDLGWPVMDDATVQSAAYILNCTQAGPADTIAAIDRKSAEAKDEGLAEIASMDPESDGLYFIERATIQKMPRARVLYSLPPRATQLLTSSRPLGGNLLLAKLGMKSFRDFRFLRARHEVKPESIGRGRQWVSLAKGGRYAIFYSDLPLVLNWRDDGREVCEVNRIVNGQTAQARQASIHYYKRGGTYSRRCKDFGVRVLPDDFIIGEKGPAILPLDCSPTFVIGLLNAKLFRALINLQANAKQYDSGLVESLPLIDFDDDQRRVVEIAAAAAICALRERAQKVEADALFVCPDIGLSLSDTVRKVSARESTINQTVAEALKAIDSIVDAHYGIDSKALELIVRSETAGADDDEVEDEDGDDGDEDSAADKFEDASVKVAEDIFSYIFGCAIGRWDIRFATGALEAPQLLDHFAALPSYPPGALVPALSAPILVDDEDSDFDVERRLREVIRLVWHEQADIVEQELVAALGARSIGDHLRRPIGFFSEHLLNYTKGKRKAPIYWPLSTTSVSYTLWIYYPSLTSQTLYTALNDFVEPKLKQVGTEVIALRNKGAVRTREDEKQFESLQTFERELIELRDTLLKLASTYRPNHDDGVQISAAPLWPLFRHKPWQKVLKDTWAKLEKGEYDWAHLAMAYWPDRVREKCKTDKSLAIAHGLEDLYVEPEAAPKKTRGRKKATEAE